MSRKNTTDVRKDPIKDWNMDQETKDFLEQSNWWCWNEYKVRRNRDFFSLKNNDITGYQII